MKNVILYGTPTCYPCRSVKLFLEQNNIKFTYYDVSISKDRIEEMIKKSGKRVVPVIDVDGKIIVGFNQTELKETLGL